MWMVVADIANPPVSNQYPDPVMIFEGVGFRCWNLWHFDNLDIRCPFDCSRHNVTSFYCTLLANFYSHPKISYDVSSYHRIWGNVIHKLKIDHMILNLSERWALKQNPYTCNIHFDETHIVPVIFHRGKRDGCILYDFRINWIFHHPKYQRVGTTRHNIF